MTTDGDPICLESDIDISHALSLNSTLKVHVYDKEVLPVPTQSSKLAESLRDLKLDGAHHDALKASLEQVRDKIDSILKIISQAPAGDATAKDAKSPKQLTKADMAEFLPKQATPTDSKSPASVAPPAASHPPAQTGSQHPPQAAAPPPPQQQQQHQQYPGYTAPPSSQPGSQPPTPN
ncbi:hypothetical protein HK097_004364, partial [Rhizophlyctis rosea]